MSSENLVDPLSFLTNQHQYTINDIKASANSLNYGAFSPQKHNQENYSPSPLEVERPKSAHPRLINSRFVPTVVLALSNLIANKRRGQQMSTMSWISCLNIFLSFTGNSEHYIQLLFFNFLFDLTAML